MRTNLGPCFPGSRVADGSRVSCLRGWIRYGVSMLLSLGHIHLTEYQLLGAKIVNAVFPYPATGVPLGVSAVKYKPQTIHLSNTVASYIWLYYDPFSPRISVSIPNERFPALWQFEVEAGSVKLFLAS